MIIEMVDCKSNSLNIEYRCISEGSQLKLHIVRVNALFTVEISAELENRIFLSESFNIVIKDEIEFKIIISGKICTPSAT